MIDKAYSYAFDDLVDCPRQPDPKKYQRENCCRLTDEIVDQVANKFTDLTTSTSDDMVQFTLPMPYYDTQKAICYMNRKTGETVMYHENGRFWGYKRYPPKKLAEAKRSGTLVKASNAQQNIGNSKYKI